MKYVEKSVSDRGSTCSRRNIKLEMKSQSITNITHTSQRNHKYKVEQVIKHLSLKEVKTQRCNNRQSHNRQTCPNYHGEEDRRRAGVRDQIMCQSVQSGLECPNGEECPMCHNQQQQLYRPERYKTRFCQHYYDNPTSCPNGDICPDAHSEQDILIQLIHHYEFDEDFYMFYFKTILCPFQAKPQHDPQICVYAHDWKDYRRNPHLYPYDPIQCSQDCGSSANCFSSHNLLEMQYHPLSYKTLPCTIKECQNCHCPFSHTEDETRQIGPQLLSRVFRIVPRNRLVEGTYKNDQQKCMQFSNTGFKAKKIQSNSSSDSKQNSKNKDNTFIKIPIAEIPDDKRFKTMISVRHHVTKLSPEKKWIPDSQFCQSDDEDERPKKQRRCN